MLIELLKTSTNIHHLAHPFANQPPGKVTTVERIIGIALVIIPGILTLGTWSLFCLATAYFKQRRVQKMPADAIPRKQPPQPIQQAPQASLPQTPVVPPAPPPAQPVPQAALPQTPTVIPPAAPIVLPIAAAPQPPPEKIIGFTFLKDEATKQPVKILIKKVKLSTTSEEKCYVADTEQGDRMGTLRIRRFRIKKNGSYGCKGLDIARSDWNMPDRFMHYGRGIQQPVPKIEVKWVGKLSGGLNGIGTALLQVAMEVSHRKKCEGRLLLEASRNAHGYYYDKIGMRTMVYDKQESAHKDAEIQRIVAEAKRNKTQPDTRSMNNLWMYLPKAGIQEWKAKIQANPIHNKLKTSFAQGKRLA